MKLDVKDEKNVSHQGSREPIDRSGFGLFAGFPTTLIAAGATAHIQAQSQVRFLGRRLVIDPAPALVVNDIRIGKSSIFCSASPIPGAAFAPLPQGNDDLETMRSMEKILTTKIGPIEVSQLVTLSVTNKSKEPVVFNACLWGEEVPSKFPSEG